MTQTSKFGIYFNIKENQVVRINSPYWIPQGPDWGLLTPEVNATLLQIRQIAKNRKLSASPDAIKWGTIPSKD